MVIVEEVTVKHLIDLLRAIERRIERIEARLAIHSDYLTQLSEANNSIVSALEDICGVEHDRNE